MRKLLAVFVIACNLQYITSYAAEEGEERSAWQQAETSQESAEDAAAKWSAWAAAERTANRFRASRMELEKFRDSCSYLAEPWSRIVKLQRSLDSVIVFDTRHR